MGVTRYYWVLAIQVDTQCSGLGYFTGLSSIAIYGGSDGTTFDSEKKALIRGADIIIATPGRLISHLNLGYVKFNTIRHLILDEADRMLDMGFHDDLMKIIEHLSPDRQTLMFSATMPPRIRLLAQKLLKNPEEVSISISRPAEKIVQKAYLVFEGQKMMLMEDILKNYHDKSIIIFSGSKKNVKELAYRLKTKHFKAAAIHSDLDQNEREAILLDFRNRRKTILVATDVLSRGIDIEGIDLLVNFDVPSDGEDYVHRIGRTARAEAAGEAITLVNERDQKYFSRIEKLIGREIEKPRLPEGYGEGPAWNPNSRPAAGGSHRKKTFRKNKTGNRKFSGNSSSAPPDKA